MSDVSWWERALGGAIPRRQSAPPPPPVQTNGYPQKAVRWQPQYPPTSPRQEVTEWDQSEGDQDDNWHRVRRQGFVDKAPANVGKSGKCPGCGGSNFFRRKGPMGAEAAPLCTECGYNGDLFTQSGTLLMGAGVHTSGPMNFARSDNRLGESNLGADPGLQGTDFNWGSVREEETCQEENPPARL